MTITQASAQSADEVETERLRAVERYAVLDTPTDDAFDRIARLAARCLGTSMAAVAVVDRDRVWFKAGYGLGDTQQIDRRLALCEPAIRDGKAVVITDTHEAPDAAGNPNVARWGIRFFAAAPIVTADGYRIGTVNVLDTKVHHPAADDIAMLTDLAAIVMDELELRLTALSIPNEAESATASGSWGSADDDQTTIEDYAAALQRSLLPPSLPNIPGITLAAHYHPASAAQVGGDFYDVFALDRRRWAFFLGDVEGHGTAAASVTSLVRYTLRAAALHHEEPTDGLAELNNVLVGDPNEKKFCTVLFGMLTDGAEPGTHRVRLATGGHPPALLLDAGSGQVRRIRPEGGMLVGAISDATFDQCAIDLEPGQTLLLYTDGITEARPAGGDCFGEEALVAFVSERAGMPAPELVGELAALVHTLRPDDDVALLALTAEPDRRPLG